MEKGGGRYRGRREEEGGAAAAKLWSQPGAPAPTVGSSPPPFFIFKNFFE